MCHDSEPQSKLFKTVGKDYNKRQYNQPVEAKPPIPWVEVSMNGYKYNGTNPNTQGWL